MRDAIELARLIELGDDAFASDCADMLRNQHSEITEMKSRLDALEKDAETMRVALEDIASGEILRSYCHDPECREQIEVANANDMASRAAGALSWIGAAMQQESTR